MTINQGAPAETPHPSLIGIISDIHANLPALEAVLERFDDMGVRELYCCGDIVGYGPHPNECCDVLRERNAAMIAGNHDHAALGLIQTRNFNKMAKQAVEWTAQRLTEDNLQFLRSLPMAIHRDDFMLVHSSPDNPYAWSYIITLTDAKRNFEAFTQPLCFIGHSHQPFIVRLHDEEVTSLQTLRETLAPGARYIVNVGSVGQPRDQNHDACCAVYDPGVRRLELIRCSYDIAATQSAMAELDLPSELSHRLSHGW